MKKRDWKKVKLGEVVDVIMGQAPPGSSYNNEEKGLALIAGAADFGDVYPEPKKYTTESKRDTVEGDILMCIRATIGDLNWSDAVYSAGRGIAVLRTKQNVSRKYLWFWLTAKKDYFLSQGRGATFLQISKKDLTEVFFPLPPLAEQKAIAAQLDRADKLRQALAQSLKDYDRLLAASFLDMFGKGERKYSLADFCEINPKKSEVKGLDENLEVSFLPMGAVSEKGEIDLSTNKTIGEVYKGFTYFKEEDVLFAKITPCMENGKGAVVRGLTNGIGFGSTEFHVLRAKEEVTADWIYGVTASNRFRTIAAHNMKGSGGQKRVPLSFFSDYKVAKPRKEDLSRYTEIAADIKKQKALIQSAQQSAEDLFGSLLQAYFYEGK
ncbi:restriction endonuclease subunit S [Saprospira grandis]|uniref:restriction endonuclease subunit S n=1 Tax=Saprospira grandis TaxID=1008 RepID=UPI0022DDEACA|nr:restriction endonuclease subunit S [Saprospira grandis]WBM74028.1 restriction endonuclease subunit S [Saprospira grandis]